MSKELPTWSWKGMVTIPTTSKGSMTSWGTDPPNVENISSTKLPIFLPVIPSRVLTYHSFHSPSLFKKRHLGRQYQKDAQALLE